MQGPQYTQIPPSGTHQNPQSGPYPGPQNGPNIPQYRQPPPQARVPVEGRPPVGARVPEAPFTHAQAVSSRIASANAAIAAIQSVHPPTIPPVPRNRPVMANVGLPQLPGGDLKGDIRFDHTKATEVVNERTAQQSASEFSSYLSKVRAERAEGWDSFWNHRLEQNREILLNENECFKSAQEDADDIDNSDDEGNGRRGRPIAVPYMYANVGAFDIPPPKPVLMPDPELVTRSNPAHLAGQRVQPPGQPLHPSGQPLHTPGQPVGQPQMHPQGDIRAQQFQSARQRASQQVRNRF